MTGPIETPLGAQPAPDARVQPSRVVVEPIEPHLRVLVADDHPLYRQGIVRALETAGAVVVGEAGDGRSALEFLRAEPPDVALVDVSMPVFDGIDVVAELARHGPDVPVVLLSAFSDEPLVRSGLQAGAAAYVSKSADRDEILAALYQSTGPAHAPSTLAAPDVAHTSGGRRSTPRLTPRERELLELARRGADESTMAAELEIGTREVGRGLANALARLGAGSVSEAVLTAENAGLL